MKSKSERFKLYPGKHIAQFMGVERNVSDYGEYLLWKFQISYGRHHNWVTRTTGPQATEGSNCGIMLRNLLGRPASDIDLLCVDLLIGLSFSVLIQYQNDYPRVESAWPIDSMVWVG
jgi:hypothetical protein